MKKFLPKLGIILFAIIILSYANVVFGAALSVNLAQDTYKLGDEFDADIKINSEDIGINAAQATIKFSPAVLEVVSIEKTGSVFNFWIQDPTFDNSTGEISFIGGASSGLIGKSLQIVRIVFKAKGLGSSDFVFTDGAATASDGSGTNVLSSMEKSTVNIASTTAAAGTTIQTIERTPVVSDTAPAKPVVKIPLYPDASQWYNTSSKFTANWTLPSDVNAVATVLNKNPSTNPTESQGVYNNETFSALSDGIWYLHVRFYNNMGWSPTNHYRIAIDTVPPPAFEIVFAEGLSSSDPVPSITYKVVDQLSGINHYYVQIDSNEAVDTKEESYKLPPQSPGKHTVKVGAEDKAGNKVENTAQFEILPIESPKIISVSTSVFVGEGGLLINGTSLEKASIILNVKDEKDNVMYSFTTNSDDKGNWAMKIDSPLKKGNYYIEITAQDSRGALSLPVKSETIIVRERPIMVLWGWNITYLELIIFLLVITIIGYVVGWYSNKLISGQRDRKILISQRDVSAAFNIIKRDIEKALKCWEDGKLEDYEATSIQYLLNHMNENIDKLQKYIITGIKDIGNKK